MKKHKTAQARGKSARARGNAFEVQIVNLLKQYGYEASSARYSSRALDDAGVDIDTNAPYYIQCKYVEALRPGAQEIIKGMPQVPGQVNILAHKRANKGTLITMSITDFCDLLLAGKAPSLSEGDMGMPFDQA